MILTAIAVEAVIALEATQHVRAVATRERLAGVRARQSQRRQRGRILPDADVVDLHLPWPRRGGIRQARPAADREIGHDIHVRRHHRGRAHLPHLDTVEVERDGLRGPVHAVGVEPGRKVSDRGAEGLVHPVARAVVPVDRLVEVVRGLAEHLEDVDLGGSPGIRPAQPEGRPEPLAGRDLSADLGVAVAELELRRRVHDAGRVGEIAGGGEQLGRRRVRRDRHHPVGEAERVDGDDRAGIQRRAIVVEIDLLLARAAYIAQATGHCRVPRHCAAGQLVPQKIVLENQLKLAGQRCAHHALHQRCREDPARQEGSGLDTETVNDCKH